ncbi:myxosortase-dependent M36 family metallopeptidase [Hyalangium gracile]|uniref:myxosortase-dependent M36 family metallopeptidase n=1 Tax=Hyalangium gracile TaxID=394092 RepID=UPI001CCF9A9D|nr:myxosortase-dependent M36 family metallopeptidase [Hyalangium gracile]
MRLKEKLLTSLLLVPLTGTSAWAKERVNFDAFLVNRESRSLAATPEQLLARGARVEGMEERLGLPTVLWNDRHATERNGALATQRPEQAARVHLQKFADLYRLTSEDISSATLQSVHKTAFGPIIARFEQKVGGIEVFRSGVSVVMDRQNNLVAITGYMTPHEAVAARKSTVGTDFQLSAADAVARAFKDLTDTTLSARSLASVGTQGDYTRFAFETGVSAVVPHQMTEPARAKKVYFTLPDGLQPAFYVELSVGTKGSSESDYYSFVISAKDGSLLFRNNQTAEDAFSYRVWAHPTDFIPYDGPQGNDPTPHPTGTPNGYQAPWVAPNLITLQNVPYSRNDPWLPPNATQTNGNNADAYADLGAPDGFQPETDLRAPTSAPGVFDYTYDLSKSPSDSITQRRAAVVNLFYLNNYLHDAYYDVGFDEISGNAQARNFGRGGLENDSIKAEAQDYLGRNNANMSTPADGNRPRMQMYVFDGVPTLTVESPANLAGIREAGSASFGATVYNVTANALIPNPAGTTLGCTPFTAGTFDGKIAVIDRGSCDFNVKAQNAQTAGAVGVIIVNNAPGSAPGLGGTNAAVTIPTLSITQDTGVAWKQEVATNNTTIRLNMKKIADLDRDGTLDNTIVAHEWGHYISNRLVGNSNGLVNNQGRSMGEGWADFHAMLMAVRDEDRNRPGNNLFQGVYGMAGYVESGGANNGYYYGIRRVPYSTDMTKNALTFKHIGNWNALPSTHPINSTLPGGANGEVHNSGEVWASMLWECYASLLNAYSFAEAHHRMKSYLVAGYKATPNSPTMLEARDALLSVVAASDPADYARFLAAFAKRGAGVGAKAPHRDSADHIGVVESFANGNNLEITSVRLDDSVTGCDQDGVLDVGETGLLTVTVKNTGLGALGSFSGTVAASGATATLQFPNGNTLAFSTIQPGASATRTVPVKLNAVTGATPRAGITVTLTEPSVPTASKTAEYNNRVHYDEALSGSLVDRFDTEMTSWTSGLINRVPGWAGATERLADGTLNRYIHVPDLGTISDVPFLTPWMQVNPTGNTVLTFKYRHSLESDYSAAGWTAPYYDGVVLEISVDDLTWYDLYLDLGVNPGYTSFLEVGDNPLSDRAAYVGTNAGFPAWSTATVNFGTGLAGLPIRFRFRMGTDSAAGAYGFDIDDFQLSNVASGQYSSLVAETSDGTVCNRRPVADVGQSPRGYNEFDAAGNPTVITLNGSASFDPDGQPLTYQWTQTAGDPVDLQGANTATPSFVADTPYDNTYAFQLVVNDGVENSLPKTAVITVLNINRLPVAVATGPGSVAERTVPSIMLDATGSTDEDGEILTYTWTQTAGPAVTLSSATASRPTFPTPEVTQDTTFTFELVANDGYADSEPAEVSVVVTNVDRLPVANAGVDQTADGRKLVVVAGTGSDPDGEAVSYAWTQVDGPSVTLMDADRATAYFVSPDVKTQSTVTLQLTVTSASGGSSSDTVTITVRPDQAPNVNAGVDLFTQSGKTVTLFGSASDPENDAITYAWTQDVTDAEQVTLVGANTQTPSFTAPTVTADTVLHFTLTATANGLSTLDTVTVTVQPGTTPVDHDPVVTAGPDQSANAGATVTLGGFAHDADGDAITYAWTQAASDTEQVTLSSNSVASPFTAPNANTVLHFTLTVTANGKTASDNVAITVSASNSPVDHAPVVTAGPDQSANAGATVTLGGFASDADGDAITYAWTQAASDTEQVTLSSNSVASPTFTAPNANTVLHFTLTVTANGKTASDSVAITVQAGSTPVDHAPVVTAGPDQSANAGATVTLGGFASDADGDAITYAWTQAASDTEQVALSSNSVASPTFTAPNADTVLHFTLTVTANGKTASDSVSITVKATSSTGDQAPLANAGAARSVNARDAVTLQGFGVDPDGDAVTYAWTQAASDAQQVNLSGANTATPSFTAPDVKEPTALHFTLTVTANGKTATSSVTITVVKANRRPVGRGPTSLEENENMAITLDASQSSDPDGDTLTYRWVQTGGPAVQLTGQDSAALQFTTPEVSSDTLVSFSLVVTDADGFASDVVPVSVKVKNVNKAPAAQARHVAGDTAGQTVTLDALGSTDPDGERLSYKWEQTDGPEVSLSTTNQATVTFQAPDTDSNVTLAFKVTVTDASGASASQTVSVEIKPAAKDDDDGDGGCSSTGSSSGGAMLLALLAGVALSRRRITLR